jgi:hypothetical protein
MELELDDDALVSPPSLDIDIDLKKRKRQQEDEVEEQKPKKIFRLEEKKTPPEEPKNHFATVHELLWNRKEHLVSFLRKVLPEKAQPYAQMVQETSVEDWVKQFQSFVIPFYRLGLMRIVVQRIMDKVSIRKEDLGKTPQEAEENYQHFLTYMNTFARLIQSLSSL